MSGFTNNETRRTPNLLHQTKNARTKPRDRLTWGVPAGVHSRGGVRRRVRCAVEPGSAYKADSWPHASPLLPVSPRARRGPAGRREQQKEAQADDSLASSARIVACAFANSSAVAASANLSSAASAAPALAGSLEGSPAAARHSDDGSLLLLTSVLSAGGPPPPDAHFSSRSLAMPTGETAALEVAHAFHGRDPSSSGLSSSSLRTLAGLISPSSSCDRSPGTGERVAESRQPAGESATSSLDEEWWRGAGQVGRAC
mmetsp:Transcript_8961/g.28386  ORF Transcript_8961/g.28386 Transcript_8961/m.28386 type:complete len:257 (-) Transcript_8961:1587-2357(-)